MLGNIKFDTDEILIDVPVSILAYLMNILSIIFANSLLDLYALKVGKEGEL